MTALSVKSNSTGVYAFVAWISSILVFIIFILWAFSPSELLRKVGITYYPSRYYAVALPSYLIVLYALVGMFYIGINLLSTLDPEHINTLRDEQARPAPSGFLKLGARNGIPEIGDLDPSDVCKLLYDR
jgi:phosphatidylinositol glycan class P protein